MYDEKRNVGQVALCICVLIILVICIVCILFVVVFNVFDLNMFVLNGYHISFKNKNMTPTTM